MRVAEKRNIRTKNRWRNSLLFCLFFVGMSYGAFAQIGLHVEKTRLFSTKVENTITETESIPSLMEVFKQSSLSDTPKSYCYRDLAFFCKVEVQLEKASKIPVKFRLGDVQYVDWLEGKGSDLGY